MPLSPGTRLGPYEVLAPLGAGGMGEVYRARDSRLERDVAVKVLPSAFAPDADRRARFERESKTVAALSHPNIVAIHDTGLHDGQAYLVMELLTGQSLREALARGGFPVRKALDIAIQTARGLAAAHEKGLVHRDLKPENVFLLDDGRVKILDFGLARAVSAGTGATETGAALTDPGVVMGTVGYMAPEQVRGQIADARSDLFALGAVLYEMLAGRRAFQRETAADTMFAIVKEDPPDLVPGPGMSPALERIIRHCLEKNPAERFQTARDVAFALEALSSASLPAVAVQTPPSMRRRRITWQLVAAGMFLLGAFVMAGPRWFVADREASWTGVLLGGPDTAFDPVIAPDGKVLAFQAMVNNLSQVAVMNPDTGDWKVLTHDRNHGPVYNLSWSPDSARIYFHRINFGAFGIFSVAAIGGDERPLLEGASSPVPLRDGSLLAVLPGETGPPLQVVRYWPDTGAQETLGGVIASSRDPSLRVSKDERQVAFVGWTDEGAWKQSPEPQLIVGDLAARTFRSLISFAGIQYPSVGATDQPGVWLATLKSGDLHQIVEVTDDGVRGIVRTLVSLPLPIEGVSSGPDGSLYLSQWSRPQEVVRFGQDGGIPERLAFSERVVRDEGGVLMLTDGRILFAKEFAGRRGIASARPGDRDFPFVETSEESFVPVAAVGKDEVACRIGTGDRQMVAVVSAQTGRITRRFPATAGKVINSIAASPDGRTLYFSESGSIWAMSSSGGDPRRLAPGHSVAPSPDGRSLIIQVIENDVPRLTRLPLAGGEPEPIQLNLDRLLLWAFPLAPNAVAPDGRIVFAVDSPDSWFEMPVIIDPVSGSVRVIPLTFSGDIHGPGWTPDGRILASGLPTRSSLWRLRLVK